MELTKKQSEALDICLQRFRNGEKYTTISGYAGSGKSTVIKFIIAALGACGIDPQQDVAYCAFTGKAAQVLTNKGCPNAKTAHKLLYQSKPLPDGGFIHMPKTELEYKVIVCDECSMLPKAMMDILLRHKVYVIFCGDPGQLPPVSRDDDNHLLDHPHIFLDEIMRQAQDSGIIQLSMKIRNGEPIDNFKTDDAMVLPKTQLSTGMLNWSDQILCGTNATRININTQCRHLLGYEKPLEPGEKIIVLKNEWDILSENENALTNGCIGTLDDFFETYVRYPVMFKVKNNTLPIIHGSFVTETGDDFGELDFDLHCLTTGESYLTSRQKYAIGRNKRYANTLPIEATYGYCITCHKSQGSEWNKVLVLEERFPFDKEEHKKWLYTAVTRGSEKVVLLR